MILSISIAKEMNNTQNSLYNIKIGSTKSRSSKYKKQLSNITNYVYYLL
jgi:hypothetical protein